MFAASLKNVVVVGRKWLIENWNENAIEVIVVLVMFKTIGILEVQFFVLWERQIYREVVAKN